jgi:flagellar basal body-associated protein FliL
MSDDTPTQRLPETTDAAGELVEERQKSKALLFTLIGVGAALLIAIIVLLIILFGGGRGTPDSTATPSDTPTVSPTPSDSPTPTPTPTATAAPPPPPDTSPGFASFSQGQTVFCNATPGPGYTTPGISFTYTAKNASSVWFIFGEGDAADAQAFPMPISGNQGDVYGGGSKVEYPCGAATAKFTLTVVGTNGQHVSKTFTVTNTGDKF